MKLKNSAAAAAVTLVFVLSFCPGGKVLAASPTLMIDQIKITSGDQFITLYNPTTSSQDLSQIELDYVSSSGKLSGLPVSGQVPPNGYYILSDGQLNACYQATINGTSLGMTTTSGSLQVWSLNASHTVKTLQDSISWVKHSDSTSAPSGDVMLPDYSNYPSQFLQRQTDANNQPIVGGNWDIVQPDITNPCQLDKIVQSQPPAPINNGNQLLPGSPPPATILAASSGGASGPSLPASDKGLMAPVVNELLPNPASPQTDANDEFIELYNPNSAAFDLSGFQLQTASSSSSTTHTYTFPSSTELPAKSFKAFYSSQTSLSLSNAGGQVWLLDPFGNTISQSDAYGTAKDGQAWALAKGKWYWTSQPTPNAANVVNQPASGSSKSSKNSSKKTASAGNVKGSPTSSSGSSFSANNAADTTTPIHPAVLALVAGLALLYGAYEYRHDLANRYHQFQRYRSTRRKTRAKP